MDRFKNESAVYIIRNHINSKVYIGSTCRLRRRRYEHISLLRKNKHGNNHLQNFANKYGIECLWFEILEVVSEDCLIDREQFFIDSYRAFDRRSGFNNSSVSGSCRGFKQSPETREKVRLAGLGRVHSEEAKKKIGDAHRGTKRTEEARKKMSQAALGKVISESARLKMSQAHKGKPKSESFKKMVAESNRKRAIFDETKEKMRKVSTGNKHCVGRVYSQETLQKMSESAKARHQKIKEAELRSDLPA